ncbi:MAG: phosphatidate cytidylyltransferase [Alphaproteobacteria bacterium]|nr:phosphatidate cytidylyltransferase [Alphaproteobacteria bacterium]
MRSGAATGDLAALASEITPSSAAGPSAGGRREIVLRIASAIVMVPLGLWVVHAGGWPLAIAAGLCAVVASAEWVRMVLKDEASSIRIGFHALMAAGALGAVMAARFGLEYVAVAALGTAAAVSALAWVSRSGVSSMAFGAFYTSLPFGAFVWIREDHPEGRLFLLALLAIVWATDIAAYFAGRGFGGPLLSPRDSPNKTWTGAIGAVVCACLAGVAFSRAAGGDAGHWLAASLFLSVVAQAGDLLESRFKRLYGVKDTSGVLPGHGGVLDRLDALMAAVFVSALIIRFMPVLAPDFDTGGPG